MSFSVNIRLIFRLDDASNCRHKVRVIQGFDVVRMIESRGSSSGTPDAKDYNCAVWHCVEAPNHLTLCLRGSCASLLW